MSKKLSIYKIAEIAGVSPSTVSKIVNGKSDVGEETRERVQKIIKQNNFRPSVSKNMSDTIAIFISLRTSTGLSNPYVLGIVTGIVDTASNLDMNVCIVDLQRVPKSPLEFTRFCKMRKISGGIFGLLTLQDDYIKSLSELLPVVTISRDYGNAGCVMADNFHGGEKALNYLLKMGHRKILMVNPSNLYPDHNYRLDGGKYAVEKSKIPVEFSYIENTLNFSDFDLGFCIDEAFANRKSPTALFVASDQEALRFIRLLGEKNIRVPEDVSVIGFDDLQFAINMSPPLTTIRQPIYDIGKESCLLLMEAIRGNGSQSKLKILNTELIIRKSVNKIIIS